MSKMQTRYYDNGSLVYCGMISNEQAQRISKPESIDSSPLACYEDVNNIAGVLNEDCPCDGCNNYDTCQDERLACEQMTVYCSGEPRDGKDGWGNKCNLPADWRYDHLFPRDPVSIQRQEKRARLKYG